jgi:flagellar biosynthesis/type III secretory pathway ATPase
MKCALVATAIAEYFKDLGKDVLLMMDSLTRFAMAQREIGLATGEPPVARGYTPSIYSMMPKLLERTGNFENGSITGIYTVLVEETTLMSRFQTPCAALSTVILYCRGRLPQGTTIRPSTFWQVSAG